MTSKRELKRRLDRIDDGGDYPKLTLCELLSADEIEDISEDLVRVDGTVYNGAGLKQAFEEL